MDSDERSVKESNSVAYFVPSDTSLVTRKTYKVHHALEGVHLQTDSAGAFSSPIVIDLSIGEEYIHGRNSVLRFSFEVNTVTAGNVEFCSSALDLIQSVTLLDRAGLELERKENVAGWNAITNGSHFSDEWIKYGPGRLAGFSTKDDVSEAATTFFVPLRCLLGIFNTTNLLPPFFLDGARLVISLKNVNVACKRDFRSAGGFKVATVFPNGLVSPLTATVTDTCIVAETYTLDARLHNNLVQQWTGQGLSFKFHGTLHTEHPLPNMDATTLYLPVKQSCTRATRVYVKASASTGDLITQSLVDTHLSRAAFIPMLVANINSDWPLIFLQAKLSDCMLPENAMTDDRQALYLWNASHGLYQQNTRSMSERAATDFKHLGCAVITLDRSTRFEEPSGQTISQKFHAELQLSLRALKPLFPVEALLTPADAPLFTYKRWLDIFVEHERVLTMSARDGTHVLY